MKLVFLVSGLMAGGLGFLIFTGQTAAQEIQGLILLLIGAVFLSVVGMMEALSRSLKELSQLIEKLIQASQPRGAADQADSTESQPESQVA